VYLKYQKFDERYSSVVYCSAKKSHILKLKSEKTTMKKRERERQIEEIRENER
jgi:hypothetical protein